MEQLDFRIGTPLNPGEEPPKSIESVLVVSDTNLHEYYKELLQSHFKVEVCEDYSEARQRLWEIPFLIHIIHLDLPTCTYENGHFDGLILADRIRHTKGSSRSVYLVSEELSSLKKAERMGFENIYTSEGYLLRGGYESITKLGSDIIRQNF